VSAPRKVARVTSGKIVRTLVSDVTASATLGFYYTPADQRTREAPGDVLPGDQVTEWHLGQGVVWVRDERTPLQKSFAEDLLVSHLVTISAVGDDIPPQGLLSEEDAEHFFSVAAEGLARWREIESTARIRSDAQIRKIGILSPGGGFITVRGQRHTIQEVLATTSGPWLARLL